MVSLNDVLLAYSNIPVDDPIAEIWGRGLQGGYKIIEYTGTLPITITADGNVLLDYCIYGNTEQTGTPTPENPIMPIGCGERTENLFDGTFEQGYYKTYDGKPDISTRYIRSGKHIISSGETYTFSFNCSKIGITFSGPDVWVLFWAANNDYLDYKQESQYTDHTTFTTPENAVYVALMVGGGYNKELTPTDISDVMLNLGSTALPYEPYGYKLPMTVSDRNTVQTVPVYIGENQLDTGEYASYSDGKIYRIIDGTLTPTDPPVPLPEIPTVAGTTTIDYDGTPKPSQMYIKYRR